MSVRALVTGATGGLGRTLVPLLLRSGYEVRATGRDGTIGAQLARQGATFAAADLRAADLRALVADRDVVFHLAALSSPWGRAVDFAAINLTATTRLLEAARKAGCTRFVHASTPSIYAETRDRLNLNEDSPVAARFANAYAATKYAGEQRVREADGDGMRTVVLRPRAIVGPHDRALLPRLLRAVSDGRVALPGGGAALVELTDVRDVATAFLAAGERPEAAGRALNLSGGTPRTVRALVERICATLGLTPRIVAVPIPVALGMARLAEGVGRLLRREPSLTRYTAITLAYSQTFDLAAACSLLDWKARFSPEDAIAHALDPAAACAR